MEHYSISLRFSLNIWNYMRDVFSGGKGNENESLGFINYKFVEAVNFGIFFSFEFMMNACKNLSTPSLLLEKKLPKTQNTRVPVFLKIIFMGRVMYYKGVQLKAYLMTFLRLKKIPNSESYVVYKY